MSALLVKGASQLHDAIITKASLPLHSVQLTVRVDETPFEAPLRTVIAAAGRLEALVLSYRGPAALLTLRWID